jgi:hypothetical protein
MKSLAAMQKLRNLLTVGGADLNPPKSRDVLMYVSRFQTHILFIPQFPQSEVRRTPLCTICQRGTRSLTL